MASPGREAREHGSVSTCAEAHKTLERLLGTLTQSGIELAGVEVRRPTLDDAFLELTGRALRDD